MTVARKIKVMGQANAVGPTSIEGSTVFSSVELHLQVLAKAVFITRSTFLARDALCALCKRTSAVCLSVYAHVPAERIRLLRRNLSFTVLIRHSGIST